MSKTACAFCRAEGCYKHCQKSKHGDHVPDPRSAQPADGIEPARIIVDFNCALCGQSGSTLIKPEDIQWE